MKLYLYICIFLLLPLGGWAQEDIPNAPTPPRLVTDLAGVLRGDQQNDLEQQLRRYNDTSSTEIAIVLVPTYGKYDRADYTFRLANKWGIGKKGKNNGLLITAAINDRKYFIATGYGLEGSIPDVIAYEVGTRYLKPNFKEGNYYEGLRSATEYLAKLPADEFKAESRNTSDNSGGWIVFLIILFVVFFVVLPIIRNKGGGGGGHYRRGGYTPPFIVFGSGGSSSGSSSGDWGGGGSDFGGFGGGSFGGGGAGGDW